MLESLLQSAAGKSRRELVLTALSQRMAKTERFGFSRFRNGSPDYSVRLLALLKDSQTELRALYPKLAFALGYNFNNPCVTPLFVLEPKLPKLSRAISESYLLFGIFASTAFYPDWFYPPGYSVSLFDAALQDCALLPKTRALFSMLLQLVQPFVTIVSGTPQTVASGDTCANFVISVEYALDAPYNFAPVRFDWLPDSATPGAGLSVIRPYTNSADSNGVFSLMGVQATGTPGTVYLTASSGLSNQVTFEIAVT